MGLPVPLLCLAPHSQQFWGRQQRPPVAERCWKTEERALPCTGRGTWGLDSWYWGSHPCTTEQEQIPCSDQVCVSQLQTLGTRSAPTAAAPRAEKPNRGTT